MIDKKWKWVATDANDLTYMFTDRPTPCTDRPVWRCNTGEYISCGYSVFTLECDWKDSLHEIIHHEDGKIEFRKARPELKVDDPVLVNDDGGEHWYRAHFAGWAEDKISAWVNGRTSFTSNDKFYWKFYKLP